MTYRKLCIYLIISFFIALPFKTSAYFGTAKEAYPKIANYHLMWEIRDADLEKLARWDVLILDMEVQHNSKEKLKKLRKLNPNIIILAYVTSQEIFTSLGDAQYASLRYKLIENINKNNWWLADKNGNRVTFWVNMNTLNLTNGTKKDSNGRHWNEYLAEFVNSEILSTGLWDGVFYDNIWTNVSWVNDGDLDVDCTGRILTKDGIDEKWREGTKRLLQRTKELAGEKYLIVGNSGKNDVYKSYLHGIMLESFPSHWENGGTWEGSMESYTYNQNFRQPNIMIVNSNTNDKWEPENYRKMRFGLGSALLSDGYYSFDYGPMGHDKTWWYDEYDVSLGKAIGNPFNIADKDNPIFKEGVWRRDFENGIVIVNSTAENKNYVFSGEQFEKINGEQDRAINNGARVNMVSMLGKDAVVLLGSPTVIKTEAETEIVEKTTEKEMIKEAGFNNGGFVRVFDERGKQTRNGFFIYNEKYPAKAQIIISDIDNDGIEEELVNYNGTISVYKSNKLIKSFRPYDGKFKGSISFAIADLNGDATKEIITGPGIGGGPQVRVFDKDGNPLIGGFFAYDEKFRGGVNVAVMDLDGDNIKEIITAAGPGGGPHIRVFTKDGKPLTGGFFAYEESFRGGVSIAVGDIDGIDGSEIITGRGIGGTPEVKIFSRNGNLINSFFAYDERDYSGIDAMTADMNNDGIKEILVNSLEY